MLLGRRGFFLDIDPENPGGGQPSQGNQPGQNGNNQQTQNPPNPPADPFEGIDIELLDPAVRDRIVAARAEFATVARQAATARDFQSRYDQTQAQLQQVQERISRGELAPRQPQQQQPQQPDTLMGELEQYYISEGIAPEQAKSFAKINAGAFEKFGNRFSGQLRESFSPIAQNVVNNNASQVFDKIMANDRLGLPPEVAQQLWERTQAMAESGQLVNEEVAQNLARIFWAKHVEANGMSNTPTTPVPPPPFIPNIVNNPAQVQNPPPNQQTRYTYPGAGAHNRPNTPRVQTALDPDTDAALAATTANWPVRPKAYKNR